MVAPISYYLEPLDLAEPELLRRLDILDWDEFHELVQFSLRSIDEIVLAKVPEAKIREGRTSGRASFPLFSYRTYQGKTDEIDPVVVGVTFSSIPEGIRVVGDIAGESIGDIIFDVGPQQALDDHEQLREIVGRVSGDLVKRANLVSLALQDANRRPTE